MAGSSSGAAVAPASSRGAGRGSRAVPLLRRVDVLSGPVLLLALLVSAVRLELPVASALRGTVVLLLAEVLPGVVVWRCLRPREGSWAEDVVAGTVLGFGGAVGGLLLATATGLRPLALALAGVAVVLLLVPATRRRVVAARTTPAPLGWHLALGLVALLQVPAQWSFFRDAPLFSHGGWRAPYVDDPYHLSLAAALEVRPPGSYPYVVGEPLRYHWFAHAWSAHLALLSGVEVDGMLFRLLPCVVTVVVPFAVATTAWRVSGRPWVGVLAALVCTGGAFDPAGVVNGVSAVTPYSPSMAPSTLVLLLLVTVLVLRWRAPSRALGRPLLLVLGVLSMGAKASGLPVVVAGAALATLAAAVARWRRGSAAGDGPSWHGLAADLATLVAAYAVGWGLLLRGAGGDFFLSVPYAMREAGGELFVPPPALPGHETAWGYALAVLVVSVAVLARGAGVVPLLRARRGDPTTWFVLGAAVATWGAATLLAEHSGVNQWWFVRSASPVLSVGSAWGVGVLLERLPRAVVRRLLVAGGVVCAVLVVPALWFRARPEPGDGLSLALGRLGVVLAVLLVAGAACAVRAGAGRRVVAAGAVVVLALVAAPAVAVVRDVRLRVPSVPPAFPTTRYAISADLVRAARWLRDHSGVHDVVATNRHCAEPGGVLCDSRRFAVAAYSARQVLVEGWAYTPDNVRAGGTAFEPFSDPALLAANDRFFTEPDDEGYRELRAHHVRWLLVDRTVPAAASFLPWARLVHEEPSAAVYRLR